MARSTNDIWQQIVNASHLPGLTSSPNFNLFEARDAGGRSHMRAPMGIKFTDPILKQSKLQAKILSRL